MWSNVFTALTSTLFIDLPVLFICSGFCSFEPHFIPYLQPNLCRTVDKVEEQECTAVEGGEAPGASDADILELSGAAQLFNVNLHDVFFSLSLVSVISRQSRKSLSV